MKEQKSMDIKRAIALLETGHNMPPILHTVRELDEACKMACDALREKMEREELERKNNEPLTPEELRGMKGLPVWVEPYHENDAILPRDMLPAEFAPQWAIVKDYVFVESLKKEGQLQLLDIDRGYMLRWVAYRSSRKEERE